MAVGDLLTEPWSIELREVLFAMCDECVSPLIITAWLDGFGVPETRDGDVERPMAHGFFASPQFLGARTMTVAIMARAESSDALYAAVTALGRAWAPVSVEDPDLVIPMAFTMDDPNRRFVVYGKPKRAAFGYANHAKFTEVGTYISDAALCEFIATDPLIYNLDEDTATATLGETFGGLAFPHGFPHGFGSTVNGNQLAINAGSIATYPVITVTAGGAGATDIELINVTTDKSWSIDLGVAAADTLVVDMAARTAMLGGVADRTAFVIRPPSEWWALEPGTNEVALHATGDGTVAEVAWHSAWLL